MNENESFSTRLTDALSRVSSPVVNQYVEEARQTKSLTEIGPNETANVTVDDQHVFLTRGFNGCIAILRFSDEGVYFEHVGPDVLTRLDKLQASVQNRSAVLLKPDMPDLSELSGENVVSYGLDTSQRLDGALEESALRKNPFCQSVCFRLQRLISRELKVELIAFERVVGDTTFPPPAPPQINKFFVLRHNWAR